MANLFKILKSEISSEEKNIPLLVINPDMKGYYFVVESDTTTKIRANAEIKGVEVPSWRHSMIDVPQDYLLSLDVRNSFINTSEAIWFKDATQHLKQQFLNAVEMGLSQMYSNKRARPNDLSPKEIKDSLNQKIKSIKQTKKALNTLSGLAYHDAEEVFMKQRIHGRFSALSQDIVNPNNHSHLNDLLVNTWLNLDSLEKTLKEASSRIKTSKSNKPSIAETHELISRLAKAWKYLSDDYPPHSKDGCFFAFLEKLGREFQINISANSVSKIVKSLMEKEKSLV